MWWAQDIQFFGFAIIVAAWTAADLTSSIIQINIESPLGGDIQVARPGKFETVHKWTTWDIKWENYIGSMVGVSDIPLCYVTCHDIPVWWAEANDHNCIKYQVIQIGPAWGVDKMTVYTNLNACCLYGQGCSWIKAFGSHKDG